MVSQSESDPREQIAPRWRRRRSRRIRPAVRARSAPSANHSPTAPRSEPRWPNTSAATRRAGSTWQIPALDGLTPREAASDPTRRDDLIRLLATFPAATDPTQMDPERLRTMLGL